MQKESNTELNFTLKVHKDENKIYEDNKDNKNSNMKNHEIKVKSINNKVAKEMNNTPAKFQKAKKTWFRCWGANKTPSEEPRLRLSAKSTQQYQNIAKTST